MIWNISQKRENIQTNKLQKELGIDQITALMLFNRGVKDFNQAKSFFRPSISELHDPFLMKDMSKAVNRIILAINKNEKVLVYGDYDVDGTTAVALVSMYLKTNSSMFVETYIPDRYNEGYGISYKSIDYALENNFTLIIALDCGIKAFDKISYANSKNVDFIICDHHKPANRIPKAIAVLDPLRKDCSYPSKELCGCGIGFKLIQAIHQITEKNIESILNYLDLVALAIGADLVSITGENRILCYHGLKVLNTNPRPGLKAIISGLKKESISINEVNFSIAPRINAAGRIRHGKNAVELLCEDKFSVAQDYAKAIDQFNTERRDLDKKITKEALDQIETNNEQELFSTVVYKADWHKGVIGIVASRLIEKYYRPTIVFTKSNDVYAASARSVKGFDIYQAIEQCKDHLIQFGGHKYAAGLTLKAEKYQDFKTSFENQVKKTIDRLSLSPQINIEANINLNDITPRFFRILNQFSPFGPGNNRPIFTTEKLYDSGFAKIVGDNKDHLKVQVYQKESSKLNCIGFGLGHKLNLVKQSTFKLAYTINENEWNGVKSLQLKLLDIKKDN